MTQIEDLILIKELGHGGYGKVYLSKKLNYNIYYATKKIQRAPIDSNSEKLKKFHAEINIMNTLHHENIIRYYGIKKTNNYYYVIMEYANGGDLHDCLEEYIKKYHRPFPEEIVQYLMRQIVEAVAFIHSYNVIHRDLKLENIMVNFDSEKDKQDLNMMRAKIKIIDFGVSKTEAKATTIIGSPNYMDPVILLEYAEYVNKQKIDELRPYSQEVDIWSLGCICYTLFTGEILFKGKNPKIILEQIQKGTYLPTNISPELEDFLSRMLRYNGEERSKASELLKHPFLIKKAKNFGKAQINPPINYPVNVWKNSNYSSQTNSDMDMPNNIQLGTETIGTINLGTVPIETQDQYDNPNTIINTAHFGPTSYNVEPIVDLGTKNLGTIDLGTQGQYDNPNTIKNTGSNGLSYYNDFMTTTNSETNMKTADVQSGQNMFPQYGGSYISVDQIPEENNNNGIPQF